MTFQVWHKNEPAFLGATDADLAAFPFGYTHVADVTTDEVGRVFQLTNHIDKPWTQNPEVETTGTHQLRSTSVGDVVVGGGKRYAYEMIGLRAF